MRCSDLCDGLMASYVTFQLSDLRKALTCSHGVLGNSRNSVRELAYFGKALRSNRQNYSAARIRRNAVREDMRRFAIPRATVASKETVGEGIYDSSEKYLGEERIGVLLLNLGGPETLADVQPFLYNLFADPVSRLFPSGPFFVFA